LAAVGLLESLMTAVIVDDLTDTKSEKNTECKGQGIANVITGFFGGMAGCAMIGQSVINVKAGGRGRLSTFFAGSFLLFLILVLGDLVSKIPMAALVAVMIMVSIGTFNWASIKNMRSYPLASNLVMITTVIVVIHTHDLAQGVFAGVLMSALFFAKKVSKLLSVESKLSKNKKKREYEVYGQVFFASANRFVDFFDFKEVISDVKIDLTQAHFWDLSAVGAIDKVVLKFRREGTRVEVIGLNEASSTIIDKHGIYDKDGGVDLVPDH
jgi:SulP family sulfate permease